MKSGRSGDYREIHSRGVDGWVRKDGIQASRLLEVVFVDIGQGDGCLLVTPEDRHMVIDAGVGDNMYRFLRWRYGGFDRPWQFEAAVISHPDADHYGGFDDLFDDPNVSFGTIYHNGIMERKGKNSLGKRTKSGRPSYLTELIRTEMELDDFLSVTQRWHRKKFPTMLNKGRDSKRFKKFRMLSESDEYMPGYGSDADLSIQVLGPVVEPDRSDHPRLRGFGSVGKTKNGHSVVLRVRYRDVSLMLGGDLNIPSENLLLSHHTGLQAPPRSAAAHAELVAAARRIFQVDVAKSCHHGSADFSTVYLAATNPIATVISSGDDEPHSHPRADALGTIGAHSRGVRPLIFSTELARSTKESIEHPNVLRAKLKEPQQDIDRAPTNTPSERRRKQRLEKQFNKLVDSIDRSVAVFGAINLRTDGHKVVIAQKIERPGGKGKKWDIYRLEPRGNGPLSYVSKY